MIYSSYCSVEQYLEIIIAEGMQENYYWEIIIFIEKIKTY